ncbi:hypothetical protein JOC34_000428 [Virgibacillus halotolerans]|uniref:hypothetical protein n=1 Tax=Virgibacillus halotolerans TaxID=1071053 RepID=UPI001961612E|nr:hypothetical protein [Virgibacillus halotolerans]MBM7598071.1 hypothetical protein [Virgibacillus halotolerans]
MAETKIDLKDLEKAWKDVADWTKDAKVEVTNQKEVQTVDGEVSISNLPEPVDVQKVEMTNQKDVIFPDLQNVKDADVKAELESIKGTQAEIIAALKTTNESLLETNKKLEGTLDTKLTGSNLEDGIPTINIGNSKGIVLADKEQIMSGSSKTFATLSRDNELLGAKKISFYVSSDQKCKAVAYFYSYVTDDLVRNNIEITAETSTTLARPSFLTMEVPVTKRVAVIVTNLSDSDAVCNVNLGISW